MKRLIREIFFLRKGERRALYFMLVLLFLSAVCRVYIASRPLPPLVPDPLFVQQMQQLQAKIDSALQEELDTRKHAPEQKDPAPSLSPLPFDPNTVSYDTLLAMNLSGFVSRNIISYRNAGGVFRAPGDLEKIYGLTKEHLHVLAPYMRFPDQAVTSATMYSLSAAGNTFSPDHVPGTDRRPGEAIPTGAAYRSDTTDLSGADERTAPGRGKFTRHTQYPAWKDTLCTLELNSVDSAGLIVLPGIGPWFAGRIIRYRELLGGYVHAGQLLEVYGMDSTRFNGMVQYVTADTTLIRRIDLNNSSFQEIISHPYISREETYAIFRYMDFVDSISQPENLLENQIIDRERFMRMAPYLTTKSMED